MKTWLYLRTNLAFRKTNNPKNKSKKKNQIRRTKKRKKSHRQKRTRALEPWATS